VINWICNGSKLSIITHMNTATRKTNNVALRRQTKQHHSKTTKVSEKYKKQKSVLWKSTKNVMQMGYLEPQNDPKLSLYGGWKRRREEYWKGWERDFTHVTLAMITNITIKT
jgi:hypothetical protein